MRRDALAAGPPRRLRNVARRGDRCGLSAALNNNSDGLAPVDEAFLKDKQAHADELFASGIMRKKLDIRDLFVTTFNDAIAHPVKLAVTP